MSEDNVEDVETIEAAEEQPIVEEKAFTCEDAKKEILQLMVLRQDLENKLLIGFDKKVFKEKKKTDRKIRNLFEDFSVCEMQEAEEHETPVEEKK